MITVYIKKIDHISEIEKQNIINSLSRNALERINKKRNEKLHISSLCALSLLNSEEQSDLEYTNSGIPFFKTLNKNISISHSNTFSAVAISNSKDESSGIDIEDISNATPTTRFLTENEKIALESGTPYTEIWTKKEALFKFLKNDSLNFINLDSTNPNKYSAKFLTTKIENSILTICTPNNAQIEIIQK